MSGRDTLIGAAIEAIVMWTRVMDSHRMIPFGELNLSRAQLEVLFHIAHSPSPATPGAIAARLGVTAGAVTQLVTGLVRRDPGALSRAALGLAKSVLGSFLVIGLTGLLLEIVDQYLAIPVPESVSAAESAAQP